MLSGETDGTMVGLGVFNMASVGSSDGLLVGTNNVLWLDGEGVIVIGDGLKEGDSVYVVDNSDGLIDDRRTG